LTVEKQRKRQLNPEKNKSLKTVKLAYNFVRIFITREKLDKVRFFSLRSLF